MMAESKYIKIVNLSLTFAESRMIVLAKYSSLNTLKLNPQKYFNIMFRSASELCWWNLNTELQKFPISYFMNF